ncbi:hypothetical protein BHQ16_15760 [Mycobacterium shimoidei]|nr:hypothetical protein BHQ16_15760 [Mycobacterium shimoidei]
MVAASVAVSLVTGCSGDTGTAPITSATETTARIATAAGMVMVQGEILAKYRSVGGTDGPLGLPIGDEQPAANGGRCTIFQNGAIYWSPQTGAHIVRGPIRQAWEHEYGGAGGPLGYPIADEQTIPGGWRSEFQHGVITYTGDQAHVEIPARAADGPSTQTGAG